MFVNCSLLSLFLMMPSVPVAVILTLLWPVVWRSC